MKRCPNCQSQYTDDTLAFCLQDGAPLIDANLSQMPTVSYGEQETVIAPPRINPSYQTGAGQNWPTNQHMPQTTTPQVAVPMSQKSPLLAIIAALLVLLLISIAGLGVWIWTNGGSPYKNSNMLVANANTAPENRSTTTATPQTSRTVSTANTANKSANVQTTPIDTAEIKTDVTNRLNSWKSNAESGDLDAYMNNYAETVDYYNKRGANRSFVRGDKAKAFSKYDSIKVTLSNITVTPDATGERAVALIDKEWEFSNAAGEMNSGKVRQQITLKKVNGQWLIAGEKDLKVYYVNK